MIVLMNIDRLCILSVRIARNYFFRPTRQIFPSPAQELPGPAV